MTHLLNVLARCSILCAFIICFLRPYSLNAQSMARVNSKIFSVNIPIGWENSFKDRDGVYCSIQSQSHNAEQRLQIGAFYVQNDPTAFLTQQTKPNATSLLRFGDSRNIKDFSYGNIFGKKLSLFGVSENGVFTGDVYAFNYGGYFFLILNIGKSKAYEKISDIIKSIKVFSNAQRSNNSKDAFIDGTISLLKQRLPTEFSEGLMLTSIDIDKTKKQILLTLKVLVSFDNASDAQKAAIVSFLKSSQANLQTLINDSIEGMNTLYRIAIESGYVLHFSYYSKIGTFLCEYDVKK